MLTLMLFFLPSLFESLICFTPVWRFRRKATELLFVLTIGCSFGVVLLRPTLAAYGLAVINCYRIIQYGRLVEGRLHETYLLYTARRSFVWLLVATLIAYGGWRIDDWLQTGGHVWYMVVALQLAIGVSCVLSALYFIRKARPGIAPKLSATQLPTLTVCIPARDETTDLEACLKSLVASDYAKLEILVLDDNSSRKRTAEVIRSFAHDGVRFIPGEAIRQNWLAKNQAYDTLSKEANGEIILFCGVDVRFSASSLRLAVEQLVATNKTMLCVVPDNEIIGRQLTAALIQPVRYAWEFALWRRLFGRPPVLGSCWLVKKRFLESAGGFGAVTRMVVPEAYFARLAAKRHQYGFIRSRTQLGIVSQKPANEQWLTAIRTRYPQLHKRSELVMLTSLIEAVGIVAVLPCAAYLWLAHYSPLLVWGCLLSLLLQLSAYAVVAYLGFGGLQIGVSLLLPVAVAYDIFTLNLSMWRYEFSQVYWKGRNITAPVMHSTPSLDD